MEGRTPEEKKKIKIINAHLDSNINGVNENLAISLDINSFFFSDRSELVQGSEDAKRQPEEEPVGWLDMVIEKLDAINAKNAGVCIQLRKLHKETT